jgi:hypothetical protein
MDIFSIAAKASRGIAVADHCVLNQERAMASTLNRTGESRPDVLKGHGTRELGPSDSSDTGSDVTGGPGLGDLEPLHLDRGASTDADRSGDTAGPDLGDSDLDSDSDAAGTGENITAGRDPVRLNRDVLPDRIIEDLSELDEDASREPAENAGGASASEPLDQTPSIDNPPSIPPGSDVPVVDRDDGRIDAHG